MKREDFDKLLKELTDENLTTERQLEIFGELQKDKDNDLENIETLTKNSDDLQERYKSLQRSKVEDFFNKGVEVHEQKKQFDNPEGESNEEKPLTYDDILAD